ncbi:hypothetical protein [Micromonospora sp. NPDC051006]|uniref:hypothetical protein n=1 Tax=Micromonospora sp. NPDC051006 TaxID=3364283 RepID=UPI003793C6E7
MAYPLERDLHLTHDPARGYWHFVLHIEPPMGAGSALNASQRFDASGSRYAAEWIERLTPCDPDALHVTLVGQSDAPRLWQPCVYDDPDSPAAVARDGCVCWQTYRDPLTWLPVAAHHYRTVSGNHETWQHLTYAPLCLADGERLDALVIDREADMIWVRSDRGNLHILPEKQGAGYSVGYRGGGPTELARMIEKIVRSEGADVSPGTSAELPNRKVHSWISSEAADRTQELTLDQLKLLCRTGMVA